MGELFEVFVEGVRDPSPQGVAKAAQALAPKLAMPAERVAKLLGGRFRVKKGIDAALAERLVRELEGYGVRAVAKPAEAAAPAQPATKPAAPAARPAAPAPKPAAAAPRPAAPAPRPAPPDDDGGISIGGLDLGGGP